MTKSENIVKKRHENRNQFVFTLDEDSNIKPQHSPKTADRFGSQASNQETIPAWERTLEQMRQHKKRAEPLSNITSSAQRQPSFPTRARKQYDREVNIPAKMPITADSKNMCPSTSSISTSQPSFSNQSHQANEVLLDPVQRECVYRTYLQQWQKKHSLEVKQQESVLNDTALLIQEDWLAAQNCLQSAADTNSPTTCTISLQKNQASILEENQPENNSDQVDTETTEAGANKQPAIHVHMHVIEPRGMANRAVACISEQQLLYQLSEKLRPHLADVLAGMVRVAVQRHTAGLVTALQRELLAEVPAAVDDVLKHNLGKVMNGIKKNQH